MKKINLIAIFIMLFMVQSFAGTKINIKLKAQGGNHRVPYFSIFLLNESKRYEKTLFLLGSDKQYYSDLRYWYRYFSRGKQRIDAVSGASLTNGSTFAKSVIIPDEALQGGYSIRVSSVAENGGYTTKEVILKLEDKYNDKKMRGKQYVRSFTVRW